MCLTRNVRFWGPPPLFFPPGNASFSSSFSSSFLLLFPLLFAPDVKGGAAALATIDCLASRPCAGFDLADVVINAGSSAAWRCAAVDIARVSATTPIPGPDCHHPPSPPLPPLPPPACPAAVFQSTTILGRSDLDTLLTPTAGGCCAACRTTARCVAFAYMPVPDNRHTVNCWLHADGFQKAPQRNRVGYVLNQTTASSAVRL